MCWFSYWHGKQEKSTFQLANSGSGHPSPFAYMLVITNEDGLFIMKDQWGKQWKVQWPDEYPISPKMLVSFRGKFSDGIVRDVHSFISHKGFMLKLYVSLGALMVLCIFCLRWFGVDKTGIYLREKELVDA